MTPVDYCALVQVMPIEGRPITLLVPSAQMSLGPPITVQGRLDLDSQATTYHADRVQRLHPGFADAWRAFHRNTTPPPHPDPVPIPDEIRRMGSGAVHLMGLIDLSLKLQDQGIPFVWKYPETYMHPGWQVALADLAIQFALG